MQSGGNAGCSEEAMPDAVRRQSLMQSGGKAWCSEEATLMQLAGKA